MKIRSWKAYLAITAVGVLSYLVMSFGPDKDFIQEIASIPFVGALVAALFVMLRDHASYERALAIQDRKNNFIVGASSHMANVAFDKHVAFAEEYVAEAQNALATLVREAPTPEVLDHATNLFKIQKKYVVWLTQSIEDDLEVFESALRKIGAAAHLENQISGSPGSEKRIAEMYKIFAEVLGKKIMGSDQWEGETLSEDRAVSMLIRRLRVVLGAEELTKLRREIIRNAASKVEDNG